MPEIRSTQTASSTYFDNSTNGFAANSVQTAIEEAKNNFSYHEIDVNEVLTIRAKQHMITTSLTVDGFIILDGGLVFL